MRGVECFWVLTCPEALGSGSSVALKDKESNALQNLARLTSLVKPLKIQYIDNMMNKC